MFLDHSSTSQHLSFYPYIMPCTASPSATSYTRPAREHDRRQPISLWDRNTTEPRDLPVFGRKGREQTGRKGSVLIQRRVEPCGSILTTLSCRISFFLNVGSCWIGGRRRSLVFRHRNGLRDGQGYSLRLDRPVRYRREGLHVFVADESEMSACSFFYSRKTERCPQDDWQYVGDSGA
jgi:hypothetical protein